MLTDDDKNLKKKLFEQQYPFQKNPQLYIHGWQISTKDGNSKKPQSKIVFSQNEWNEWNKKYENHEKNCA